MLLKWKEAVDRKWIGMRSKWMLARDNAGMGTVEVILIIVVLVGLVVIFKEEITDLVSTLFAKITRQAASV